MKPALLALANWLRSWGPFGLFLAAALDSFVPLGHVVDPMVIYLSYRSRNPLLYAGIATLGSVLGTSVFFLLVRRGGQAWAARHPADPEVVARNAERVRRWGALMVLVGGILPPPFPFKVVIVLAALRGMRLPAFVAALSGARLFRYGLEAVLAVSYGDQVIELMKRRYPMVGLGIAAVLVASALLLAWRRSRVADGGPAPSPPPASPELR